MDRISTLTAATVTRREREQLVCNDLNSNEPSHQCSVCDSKSKLVVYLLLSAEAQLKRIQCIYLRNESLIHAANIGKDGFTRPQITSAPLKPLLRQEKKNINKLNH